jgi:diguanylate cyclase (GGDEF)-like protein
MTREKEAFLHVSCNKISKHYSSFSESILMTPIISPECQELLEQKQILHDEVVALQAQVSAWNRELKRRNLESDLLNRLGDTLMRCQSIAEIQEQLDQYVYRLFMEQPGELFLINENTHGFEKTASWGGIHPDPTRVRKEYCPTLERGQLFSHQNGELHSCSYHTTLTQGTEYEKPYLCTPVRYQNNVVGVLHQHVPEAPGFLQDNRWLNNEHWEHLVVAVSERLTSAITTINIREKLKTQSQRDPLTRLFNRWYMEETLEREIHYAKRHQTPLWVFSLDVDRMKGVNEKHGFNTGDDMLRQLSAYLQQHVRAEDVACRSGGDEFTLLLLGMPEDAARKRAENLRQGIHELHLNANNHQPINTTASFGLAAFPNHGQNSHELLGAVSQALHQAKAKGRDQVMVA